MGSLLALVVVAGSVSLGRLQIQSDVACPTADDVSASLHRLIGDGQSTAATLSVSGGPASSFEVRLVDGGGGLVARRTWSADGPCAATTEAVAVVAATWLGDLPPISREIASPPPPAPPPAVPELRIAAPPPPTRSSLAWAVVAGAGVASPIAAPGRGALSWPVAALKVAGEVGGVGEVAPFGALGFVADLPRDHEVATGFDPTDGLKNGPGAYSWYRWAVEPMGGVTVRTGRTAVAVSAGLSLGMLVAHGTGYVSTPDYQYLDGAAVVEVRAHLTPDVAAQRVGLWVALRGRAATNPDKLESLGPVGPGSRFEAGLLMGGDFSWSR